MLGFQAGFHLIDFHTLRASLIPKIMIENQPEFEVRDFVINTSMKEELGCDTVFFDFRVYSPEFTEIESVFAGIPMSIIVNHMHSLDPKTAEYVENVRYGIHGLGPMESKVVEILNEEDFDFYPWVVAWVRDKMNIWGTYEQQKGWKKDPQVSKKAKEVVESLREAAEEGKHWEEMRNDLFLKLFKSANDIIVEELPSILEQEPEDIKELEYMLYKHLPKLVDDALKLGGY